MWKKKGFWILETVMARIAVRAKFDVVASTFAAEL